jgi:long-chain acyl-CoA synthetase
MASTTPSKLLENAMKYADQPALSTPSVDGWVTETWAEVAECVMDIARALVGLGFNHGDKLSLYSYNCKEWYGGYLAAQMVGGAGVGVYHTSSAEEVEWVVSNSESKVVFVGNNPMAAGDNSKMPQHRLMEVIDALDKVEHVVLLPGVGGVEHAKLMTWNTFIGHGSSIETATLHERMGALTEEDTSALIYTSGTTGNPKGVELTHGNFNFEVKAADFAFTFHQGERYVSWLPLAHVFGQLIDNHYWVDKGLHMYVADNPLNVVDLAKEVQPHLFIGVPRIYEKLYSNVRAAIDGKAILRIGLKLPLLSGIFRKILKKKTGMKACRFAVTGAAPINPDILELFQSLGIPIFEGYGMTEDTAGATLNYAEQNRVGTVGTVFPGTEMKVADDGELLIRGPHVMKGYYKNQTATDEVLKDDWLYTGDVGTIDGDGFVKITGRKKEIYVSSGGKNIAPLVIEETMKSMPLVSQCFLVGDGRKYCSALLTLDAFAIMRDKLGMDPLEIPKNPVEQVAKLEELGHPLDEYTESTDIRAEIQEQMDELNGKFSPPEQVKKFAILSRDFTVDDGELTPTLKIKRKPIAANWAEEIESLYVGA